MNHFRGIGWDGMGRLTVPDPMLCRALLILRSCFAMSPRTSSASLCFILPNTLSTYGPFCDKIINYSNRHLLHESKHHQDTDAAMNSRALLHVPRQTNCWCAHDKKYESTIIFRTTLKQQTPPGGVNHPVPCIQTVFSQHTIYRV